MLINLYIYYIFIIFYYIHYILYYYIFIIFLLFLFQSELVEAFCANHQILHYDYTQFSHIAQVRFCVLKICKILDSNDSLFSNNSQLRFLDLYV